MNVTGRLENWSLVFFRYMSGPYSAPELRDQRINGIVYGHSRFKDGESITTSTIDKIEDGKVYTASGSVYILGEVSPDYEKSFPNAKKRLFGEVKP